MKYYAYLNAYSQGLSGGDACFLNVAGEVSRRKEKLVIVTSSLGRQLCQSREIKADYMVTSREKSFSSIWLTYGIRIIKGTLLPRPEEGSVLYATSDFLPDVLPCFVKKGENKKDLWVQKIFHLIPKERVVVRKLQDLSFWLIKKSADVVIVDNLALKGELVSRYRFKEEKVHVIPPGLDLEAIKRVKTSKDKFQAVFVGQLRESKGIFDLVNIWKEVVRHVPIARLAVIGKDVRNNDKRLREMVSEAGLESKIVIKGMLERNDEVYSYMKSSDVLLLPSYEEGFGMVVAEAMACGVQPVGYDLPVIRENFGGLMKLSPVSDKEAIAKNVIKALHGIRVTPKRLRTSVRKFDKIAVVKQELELIENACGTAR